MTRGVFVRIATDRLAEEGVPRGAEGLTLFRDESGRWRISANGEYVDAYEPEFEVVGPALRPRGVVLPSLNGGWLTIEPYHDRSKDADEILGVPVLERWGRRPDEGDFLGFLQFRTHVDGTGFPVLWDRERQLKLMYFLGAPDHTTVYFPRELDMEWPDPELQIEGAVTIDPARNYFGKKAAELDVTARNPIGDRRTVCGRLVVPAYTCKQVSEWLVDLFPSVSADDLDFI